MTAELGLVPVDSAPPRVDPVETQRPLRSAIEPAPRADRQAAIVRFSRKVLQLTLWPRQAEMLAAAYRSMARIIVFRLGRRSGKGVMAAVVAVFEATANAEVHLRAVRPGEQVVIAVVANSAEQARVLHRYIRGLLMARGLAHLVVPGGPADEIELTNGVVISVLATSGRTIRGRAIAVVVIDELAHALDGEGRALSPQAASEILDALIPSTAQFPGGKVIILSTPRYAFGEFYKLCQQAAADEFPDIIGFHFATSEVNPTIGDAFFSRERARDPVAFRREYGAEFAAGFGMLFDELTVRSCVAPRGDLPPVPGRGYLVAIDPAYSGDAFALVVGHFRERKLIVDLVRSWRGTRGRPVDNEVVLDEATAIATAYNRASIVTDQYAAQPILSGLRKRGTWAEMIPWGNENKFTAAQALRQRFYADEVELPNDAELVAELVALEQRLSPTGKPIISAPPGASDDRAFALLALALVAAVPQDDEKIVYLDPETGGFTFELPELVRISPV